MRLARISQIFLILLITLTIRPNLPAPLARGSQQDFGTCNSLPQGWTCGNTSGLTETTVNITNGVLETDLYATGVGNDNNYQFATSQKGTFPWSPCQQPATGVIPANLTIVRSTFTPLALPTTGRYHIYIALYYWLPNGAVSARGATYRCLDTQSRVESIGGTFSTVGTNATYDPGDSFGWNNVTLSNITVGTSYTLTANETQACQSDYLSWGINPATPCQLAGIEIGVEGFQFDTLKVLWPMFSTNSILPPAKPAPPSLPIVYYTLIGMSAAALLTLLVFAARRRSHKRRATEGPRSLP